MNRSKTNRGHETKWELVLDVEIEECKWKKIYSINFESCIESSLRAFQYSILLRTLPTNRHLSRCYLVNTDKCFFCQVHIETIEHLFWSCVVIRNFVFTIMDKINVPGEIKKEIGAVEFLLGYTSSSTYKNLNFLFTLIKKFVFMTKSSGSQLCVNRFKGVVKYYYDLEKSVVLYNYRNMSKHMDKWNGLVSLL